MCLYVCVFKCGESTESRQSRLRAWKCMQAKKNVCMCCDVEPLAVFSSLSLSFCARMTERVKPKARVFWKHTPKFWLTPTMCCWEVFRAKRARDEKNKHGKRREGCRRTLTWKYGSCPECKSGRRAHGAVYICTSSNMAKCCPEFKVWAHRGDPAQVLIQKCTKLCHKIAPHL